MFVQKALYVYPLGHCPPSGAGMHGSAVPPQLGRTQISPVVHARVPHIFAPPVPPAPPPAPPRPPLPPDPPRPAAPAPPSGGGHAKPGQPPGKQLPVPGSQPGHQTWFAAHPPLPPPPLCPPVDPPVPPLPPTPVVPPAPPAFDPPPPSDPGLAVEPHAPTASTRRRAPHRIIVRTGAASCMPRRRLCRLFPRSPARTADFGHVCRGTSTN